MNILICSVGRRVQLINYFKKELNKINGKVIAADCDPTAPALYHADLFEVVPRIDHPEYISVIKHLCKKYDINGILTLIDPELTLLTSYKSEFEREGVQVIVSDKKVIDICYDKYLTYQFLQDNDLPSIPTYIDLQLVIQDLNKGRLKFPLIVKPQKGSASIGVQKITNINDLKVFWETHPGYIVQPFMDNNEYCVECYIDLLTHNNTSQFSKRKFNMRGGETDKSIVVRDSALNQITKKLIESLKPIGPVDIDFFKTVDGYKISEINPRFGGGYPYAYEMGNNFIVNIINNLKGIPNIPVKEYLGEYEEGEIMVRYDHFAIL